MAGNPTNSAEQMLYAILLTLTFVSGLVDAASFLALGHVFTANMTGNVVLMCIHLGVSRIRDRSQYLRPYL